MLGDASFWKVLGDTFLIVLTAGPLALAIASVFAWLNERTDARMGVLSGILPLVPFLMPPIAISVGWVFLAQPRAGFVNVFLRSILEPFGYSSTEGPLNIGTLPGLIFVYTIVLVPYAYLVVSAALRNMDTSLEEASRMSGSGLVHTLLHVTLPAIRPALASSALLLLIMGVSLFSIPRVIGSLAGIETLSVYIVQLIQTFPSRLDEAVAVSVVLLVVVAAAWSLQRRISMRSRQATVPGKSSAISVIRLGRWRWAARSAMMLYVGCATVLPTLALLVVSLQPYWSPSIVLSNLTFKHFEEFFSASSRPFEALFNSLRLGLLGATACILIAAVLIALGQSRRGHRRNFIEGVTKVPGAVSNIVIGVAILVALAGPPFNLGGTLIILLLAYVVINMPQASINAEVARGQIGNDLVEASQMAGASGLRTLRKILLPLMAPGLMAGWAMLFVVIVGDLTASAILSGLRNLVVGSVFLIIWESGQFAELAVLGLVVSVTSMVVVGAALALGRRSRGVRRRGRSIPRLSGVSSDDTQTLATVSAPRGGRAQG